MIFKMNAKFWIVLSVINIPVYFLVGKFLFFSSWDDFFKSFGFILKPWWFSAWNGEFWEDWWESTKFLAFVVVCGVIVYFEAVKLVIPVILPAFSGSGT